MAMSSSDGYTFFLRVLGMLRSTRGEHDPREIALSAYRAALAAGPTYSFSEWLSIATRAARANEIARASAANPYRPIEGPGLPIDPTADSSQGYYSYRVVIEVFDHGRRVASTAVTVGSNVPLSPSDLHWVAIDIAIRNLPGSQYRSRVANYDPGVQDFRTVLISAGVSS